LLLLLEPCIPVPSDPDLRPVGIGTSDTEEAEEEADEAVVFEIILKEPALPSFGTRVDLELFCISK
jgi:hypothetical protein